MLSSKLANLGAMLQLIVHDIDFNTVDFKNLLTDRYKNECSRSLVNTETQFCNAQDIANASKMILLAFIPMTNPYILIIFYDFRNLERIPYNQHGVFYSIETIRLIYCSESHACNGFCGRYHETHNSRA